MKRKNLFLSLFCLVMMTMTSITFMSCGDDKDDEYKPVLMGLYRTPYVKEAAVWIEGSAGVGTTGHYANCKSFLSYNFTEDGKLTFYSIHNKSCVINHRMVKTDNTKYYPILDNKGDSLDWYIEGEGQVLSYTIDYETNKVAFSNGEQYSLKNTGKAVYESLLDNYGNDLYVLGYCTDEKYNNTNYYTWLANLKYNEK